MNKTLKFYVNSIGRKIKTDGLTINQNSSNNTLKLICADKYDLVEVFFKSPSGSMSPKYHMILKGTYEKTEEDLSNDTLANTDLYEWNFNIPYAITSFTITGSSARMDASFACYKYDENRNLNVASIANTQITVNQASTSLPLDQSYNMTDVENLWKAVATTQYLIDGIGEGIIEELSTNNYYTKSQVDALVNPKANSSDVYTKTAVDNFLSGKASISSVYTKSEVDSRLATKMDLTSLNNFYTKPEIDSRFSSFDNTYATVTYVDNGLSQKANISSVPTKVSDLTNDSGYITNASISGLASQTWVNNQLVYKQNKLEAGAGITITSDNVISATANIEFITVTELPTTDIHANAIYLKENSSGDNDNYEEYVYVGVGTDNPRWEKIGSTEIDLSNYATTTQLTNVTNTIPTTLFRGTGSNTIYIRRNTSNIGSGIEFKTISGQSIFGTGNITVGDLITIDNTINSTSTNPVQNKVIKQELDSKVTKRTDTGNETVYGSDGNLNEENIRVASTNVASAIIKRDANGRAQIETPSTGSDIANKTYVDTVAATKLDSNTSFATINGNSVKSNTNFSLQPTLTSGTGIDISDNTISVDTNTISTKANVTSEINSIKGNVSTNYDTLAKIEAGLGTKQNTLIAGSGITISNNTISANFDFQMFESVSVLPVTGEPNKIYLVPKTGSTNDVKDEYIWINTIGWEKIGTLTVDLSDYYTKSEIDGKVDDLEDAIDTKQNTLVSGTNIKTVNGESLLGSGNIEPGLQMTFSSGIIQGGRDLSSIVVGSGADAKVWNIADRVVRSLFDVSTEEETGVATLYIQDYNSDDKQISVDETSGKLVIESEIEFMSNLNDAMNTSY